MSQEQRDASSIAQAIRRVVRKVIREEQVVRVIWGVVSAPVTTPVHSVTFTPQGSTTGIPGIRYSAGYNGGTAPVANDVAWAAAVGSDWFVVDKLA